MKTQSIRFQLIAWYTALLSVVFVLFGFSMCAALNHYLVRNLRDTLLRRARQIATMLKTSKGEIKRSWLEEQVTARFAPESSGRYVRVTAGDSRLIYESGIPKDNSFDATHLARLSNFTNETFRSEKLEDEKELMVEALPVTVGRDVYLVEVGAPRAPLQAVLNRMLISLGVGVPLVIVVACGGAYVLIGRALTPVDRIARSAERISLHNLNERLPVAQTGDELETLSLALNRMITRINDAYDYTRRFVADASHELRTPLTIIRGELENAAQKQNISSENREVIGSTLEEVERLAKIVEGLFALSRLDSGEAQSEWVRFDLSSLVSTTTEQMCLLAEDKGVGLRCDVAAPITIEGDRARMKQVIVNLLDNAIKYTPQGGAVEVRTKVWNNNALLEVVDNGIGIPVDALPHVFERFYRVDKARSRDLGGAGLGLSIVKSISRAHGAQVEAESVEGKGSCFRLILPLAPASSSS